jgi:hypothetical protein
MSRALAWWRGLPSGARWGLLAAALVVLAIVARVWSAAVLAFAAMVAGAIGRAPGRPAAADAASRARTAAELQAASARVLADVHRSEHDAARVRDREADRAMVEAAERAALAPVTGEPAEVPAFLAEVERRGGHP